MSFIGYRDFGDRNQFVIEDFSRLDKKNVLKSSLYQKLKNIRTEGGCDEPEDIRGAIKQVLKLKWRSGNKFVVLIADAPTHGKRYYEQSDKRYMKQYDDYPEEDIQDAIKELMMRKIGFIGVEFTNETDKMFKELAEIYKQNGMEIYFALEDMKKLTEETENLDERVRRFMDLVGTKIKETNNSNINSDSKKIKKK